MSLNTDELIKKIRGDARSFVAGLDLNESDLTDEVVATYVQAYFLGMSAAMSAVGAEMAADLLGLTSVRKQLVDIMMSEITIAGNEAQDGGDQ